MDQKPEFLQLNIFLHIHSVLKLSILTFNLLECILQLFQRSKYRKHIRHEGSNCSCYYQAIKYNSTLPETSDTNQRLKQYNSLIQCLC